MVFPIVLLERHAKQQNPFRRILRTWEFLLGSGYRPGEKVHVGLVASGSAQTEEE